MPSSRPLWRDEFSIHAGEERYVSRRQLTKFLTLTSLGMLAGQVWILLRGAVRRAPAFEPRAVALAGEIPVGGVKLFDYPAPGRRCILVRTAADTYVAYSQKCTHLSCAVYYSRAVDKLVCPCHEGFFSIRDGSVLQGPPRRPLPRVRLERRGDELVAVGMEGEG